LQPKHLTIALALALGVAVPALAQSNVEAGKAVYDMKCKACHMSIVAPKLNGVAGRKIASVAGYTYSEALKSKASQKWTDANLQAYIAAPVTWAPGGKMAMAEADPTARGNLIAYLKTLK